MGRESCVGKREMGRERKNRERERRDRLCGRKNRGDVKLMCKKE